MTSNVKLGHDYERAYAERLRNIGYRVQRSAASKGMYDLTAYDRTLCVHVQCKEGRLSCDAARAWAEARGTDSVPVTCVVRVVHKTVRSEYCVHDG